MERGCRDGSKTFISPPQLYVYKLWSILAPGIFTGSFFVLQFINMILVFGDLQKVMDTCYLLVTYVGEISKFACLRWHAKRVEALLECLKTPMFMPRQKKHFIFMDDAMRIVRRDSLLFLSTAISAVTFWSFYPLVDDSEGRELAYVMWCPININDTTVYVGTYCYQVIAVVYNTAINTMMDTTICGLMRMMSGHLDILNFDLRTIFDEDFIKPGSTVFWNTNIMNSSFQEHSDRSKVIFKESEALVERKNSSDPAKRSSNLHPTGNISHEEIHSRLVSCVQYYLAIESFVKELNDIFENGILMQFAASCLIVCVTSFELTKAPLLSIQFASILQYQGCMILQIFIYCWRGHELTIKFSELSDAIYSSSWINAKSSFHKSMDVIMSRLQKPTILYLGGLISLSVDTFISVIKSAYSFYVFLKEVDTKE